MIVRTTSAEIKSRRDGLFSGAMAEYQEKQNRWKVDLPAVYFVGQIANLSASKFRRKFAIGVTSSLAIR
jgi:hypothetical protein